MDALYSVGLGVLSGMASMHTSIGSASRGTAECSRQQRGCGNFGVKAGPAIARAPRQLKARTQLLDLRPKTTVG